MISPSKPANTSAILLAIILNGLIMVALPEGNEPFSRMRRMIFCSFTSRSIRPRLISSSSSSAIISLSCSTFLMRSSVTASTAGRFMLLSCPSLPGSPNTGNLWYSSTVICRTSFSGVGIGRPGLNSWAMILMPLGGSRTLTSRCTPKASFIEPAISLYLFLSISEKENSSTKKASNSDIRSAKVITHAGMPSGQSCSSHSHS